MQEVHEGRLAPVTSLHSTNAGRPGTVRLDDAADIAATRKPTWYRLLPWLVRALDVGCLWLALAVGAGSHFAVSDHLSVAAIGTIVWLAVFHSFHLYALRNLSIEEEARRVFGASSAGILAMAIVGGWLTNAAEPVAWIGPVWLSVLLFELCARSVFRRGLARMKSSRRLNLRTLVVGSGSEAELLARTLEDPQSGYAPLGFVTDSDSLAPQNGIPVVGSIEHLAPLIRDHNPDCLFVCPASLSGNEIAEAMRVARSSGVEVRMWAGTMTQWGSTRWVEATSDAVVYAWSWARSTRAKAVAKRVLDVTLAGGGLVLSLPLCLIISACVRLSGKTIFFKQERVTKNGRIFTMYKFRTMHENACQLLPDSVDVTTPFFKLEVDPRLTKAGTLLRRFSLDELPQLFNVLKGDMSMVGPRPLPVEQVGNNYEELSRRLGVLAGLTGWWQINGRSELEASRALEMDHFYLENWSLGLDLYILWRTVGTVVGRRGAY